MRLHTAAAAVDIYKYRYMLLRCAMDYVISNFWFFESHHDDDKNTHTLCLMRIFETNGVRVTLWSLRVCFIDFKLNVYDEWTADLTCGIKLSFFSFGVRKKESEKALWVFVYVWRLSIEEFPFSAYTRLPYIRLIIDNIFFVKYPALCVWANMRWIEGNMGDKIGNFFYFVANFY